MTLFRKIITEALLILLLLALPAGLAQAQKPDPNDPKNIEKGKQLIQTIIEMRGGARYLNFKTLLATGQYTPFDKGISTVPSAFTDYIIYPDKERVEFGKKKKKDRTIQVNAGKTGWIYSGDNETLKDQDEKQIRSFLEGLEFDLDRILRVAWREEGAKTWFHLREELRPGERADVVAIQLKSGKLTYILIDPYSRLPLKIVYEKPGEQGTATRHEVRFSQYVTYDGVKFPNIVDFYQDGVQTARVNFESIRLDQAIPDALFVKPASVKEIK
jgi:outer membrane lipoprotein-sorting protein